MIVEGKVALITGGSSGIGKGFANALMTAGSKLHIPMIVEGKVAVVTGGASGIGKGFAEALTAAGAKIVARTLKVERKVAILTGGSKGIGKGLAEALVTAHAKVCIADVNVDAGEATVSELNAKYGEGNAIFCKCNVVSQTEFEGAFKKTKEVFGGIDIVVNNAGIGGESDDKWENVIDVNMKGTIRGMRLAMNYLSIDNGGHGGIIVNMASAAGMNPNPFSPTYGCTKAGIIHATRSYAISAEAKRSNIRLMVMCPAFVDTPMFRNLSSGDTTQFIGGDQEKVNAFINHIGVLTVEEVAATFMEMIQDDSKNGLILNCGKNTGNKYCTLAVQPI